MNLLARGEQASLFSRRKEASMTRLEAAVAWLFSCLGVVLLACSILVVPVDAFADTGNPDCATQCSTDLDPTTCMQNCCTNTCLGDQTCYNNCMAQLGG